MCGAYVCGGVQECFYSYKSKTAIDLGVLVLCIR